MNNPIKSHIHSRELALLEGLKDDLKSCTEDFDSIYKKFPAKEAAIIIQNRINNLFDEAITHLKK
jgi:hypothetical protein